MDVKPSLIFVIISKVGEKINFKTKRHESVLSTDSRDNLSEAITEPTWHNIDIGTVDQHMPIVGIADGWQDAGNGHGSTHITPHGTCENEIKVPGRLLM